MDWFYKAMQELDEAYDNGELTDDEYRREARDLQQEARESEEDNYGSW